MTVKYILTTLIFISAVVADVTIPSTDIKRLPDTTMTGSMCETGRKIMRLECSPIANETLCTIYYVSPYQNNWMHDKRFTCFSTNGGDTLECGSNTRASTFAIIDLTLAKSPNTYSGYLVTYKCQNSILFFVFHTILATLLVLVVFYITYRVIKKCGDETPAANETALSQINIQSTSPPRVNRSSDPSTHPPITIVQMPDDNIMMARKI